MVLQMRDGDRSKLLVVKVVIDIIDIIARKLVGRNVGEQADTDKLMVETLDGTKNEWRWSKAKISPNATLATSMTVCRAGAAVELAEKAYRQVCDARILSQRDQ